VDSVGHHPTEKALAVRPYPQNSRQPTAKVIGVRWWKVKDDQDDLYGDGSTTLWCGAIKTFKKQCWWPWTDTTGRDSWIVPMVLADHGSDGGGNLKITKSITS